MFDECTQSVTVLYAAVFGAGDACIRLDTWSLLWAIAAFILLVLVAQFAARKLWARVTQPQAAPAMEADTPVTQSAIKDDPKYKDSAIWSRKR